MDFFEIRVAPEIRELMDELCAYKPFETELQGLNKIDAGMRFIWVTILQDRDVHPIEDIALGAGLIGVGLWQLRVPIAIGIVTTAFAGFTSRTHPLLYEIAKYIYRR